MLYVAGVFPRYSFTNSCWLTMGIVSSVLSLRSMMTATLLAPRSEIVPLPLDYRYVYAFA